MNLHNVFIKQIFKKYKDSNPRINISFEDLKKTQLFNEFPNCKLIESIDIKSDFNNIKVFLVSTNSKLILNTKYKTETWNFADEFCICAFEMNKDFGFSIIRTKYIIDKVMSFFERTDIKTKKFREFDNKYLCFSNHRNDFKSNITKEIVDLFQNFDKDITVEFNSKKCFIKTKKSIKSLETNLEIINFSLNLKNILNNKTN